MEVLLGPLVHALAVTPPLLTSLPLRVLSPLLPQQASQDSLDLKVFLRQLFDQTRAVKVLVTSSRPVCLLQKPEDKWK